MMPRQTYSSTFSASRSKKKCDKYEYCRKFHRLALPLAKFRPAGLGHRPTVYNSSIERRLTKPFLPFERVTAETSDPNGSCCT